MYLEPWSIHKRGGGVIVPRSTQTQNAPQQPRGPIDLLQVIFF